MQSALFFICKVRFANRSLSNVGGVSIQSKIRDLRKQHKLSQEELAMAVGTTRQTITSIEVEKYTASLVLAYKIAKYFGLPIEEVFDFSDVEEE